MSCNRDIAGFAGFATFGDVLVCGMDGEANLLFGEDGRTYCEIHPNVWADRDDEAFRVAYLGTSRHGSWIILRPLFVFGNEGWVNAGNGRSAPQEIMGPFCEGRTLL